MTPQQFIMETDSIVVGLDIGTTKICAVAGRNNEYGKLEILGMGKADSDGVIRGIVTNIDKTIASIIKAIEAAAEQAGIEIQVVNVGIAGQHIRSSIHHNGITRKSQDDEITVEDIAQLTNEMYRIVIPPGTDIIHVIRHLGIRHYNNHWFNRTIRNCGINFPLNFKILDKSLMLQRCRATSMQQIYHGVCPL